MALKRMVVMQSSRPDWVDYAGRFSTVLTNKTTLTKVMIQNANDFLARFNSILTIGQIDDRDQFKSTGLFINLFSQSFCCL